MHEFKDLQETAAELYSDKNMRQWLFTHTYTQDEYLKVRHALKVLAEFQPVEWTGPAGHREPVPMEVKA